MATIEGLLMLQTTSARADFCTQILNFAALLQGPRGAVLAAMLGDAHGDPALAKALGTRFLAPRRLLGQ